MVKSKRLEPIANLAKNSEREAARALGGALTRLQEQSERLEQLITYQGEYHQRLNASGSLGMNVQKLNEYREFIAKLGTAIEQQQGVVKSAGDELEEKKRFWFALRGRSKALDNVLDRYLQQERQRRDKIDQRETDDLNNRPVSE